jgi:hypothetical protein
MHDSDCVLYKVVMTGSSKKNEPDSFHTVEIEGSPYNPDRDFDPDAQTFCGVPLYQVSPRKLDKFSEKQQAMGASSLAIKLKNKK